MKQAIMCALRFHKYEVYKEETIVDVRKENIGKLIICRCQHCGKIKNYKIITNINY